MVSRCASILSGQLNFQHWLISRITFAFGGSCGHCLITFSVHIFRSISFSVQKTGLPGILAYDYFLCKLNRAKKRYQSERTCVLGNPGPAPKSITCVLPMTTAEEILAAVTLHGAHKNKFDLHTLVFPCGRNQN
jgi:hypothetical protein